MKNIRFTQAGYEKMQKDYEKLLSERPDAVEHLKKARELGDLSENGYYKASRAKLSFIDSQLSRMKYQLREADIVNESAAGITIGKTITLTNKDRKLIFRIVGDLEANPGEGTISLLSPIGKSVQGKKEGDEVSIFSPQGEIKYTLTSVTG